MIRIDGAGCPHRGELRVQTDPVGRRSSSHRSYRRLDGLVLFVGHFITPSHTSERALTAEIRDFDTPPLPARLEHVLILGMDYGLVLFTSDRGINPAAAANLADDHGFKTFYVPEHTHIPIKREAAHPTTGDESLPDDRYMRTLDPWVSLGAACAVTSRVRLSTAVALPVEHDPITLAKSIATLDHLSGGRVSLGVGFGWNTTNSPTTTYHVVGGAPCCASTSRPCARCGPRRKPNTTASS